MKIVIIYSLIIALFFLNTTQSYIDKTTIKKNNYRVSNDDKIKNCTYKGFKLYGKIKIVENFPDIKVQIVENFSDLKVKIVDNFPDKCGRWQFVDNFPDIKVKFVDNFPDIKVKFVENFPGEP
jgi:hypothetical protein